MSATIETAAFCPQYYATFEVQGSKDNVYTVTLSGGEGPAHCTCPAFKYSGEPGEQDCKHVRKIWAHGCLYNPQWKDAGPNDLEDNGIQIASTDDSHVIEDEPCPGCGEPCVAVRIAV